MSIQRILSRLQQIALIGAVLALSGAALVAAGTVASAEGTCTSPSSVGRPNGADSGTYSYNCSGPYAGKWTNQYYAYDPSTGARVALYSPDYSYDCNTKTWTMTLWSYSPASGKFYSSRVTAPTTPGLPTNCAAPVPTATAPTGGSGGGNSTAPSGISNSGPGSSNATNNNATLNSAATHNTTAGMNNNVSSHANTGDANVVGNTTGGSAGSGDAQVVANIANMLQSTTNVFGPDTAVFTADINGNVNGDFMFDPAAIMATGPNSNNNASNNVQINQANVNNVDANIHNTIDVGATSGHANVNSNTTGGDATSGNARAVVNLMNLINSNVASGKSFVGTININGDLNGDILLPPGMVDALLASSGPNSSNSISNNTVANSTVANNVALNSTTNVNSSTKSGNADVSGNTKGGSATSGNTDNNITVLNLTGSNTIGKNNILVFVNVLGKWVGMIMNAPQGTTAASLGGGITSSGPNSNNSVANNAALNSSLINNAQLGITNDVNVSARSGDAKVTSNTTGGNAKSGDASTAVNVLNMNGSNINLSDWFGVLFINVFGIWNGSFGVNTAAGNALGKDPATNPSNNPVQAATHRAMQDSFRRFAGFSNRGTTPTGSSASQKAPTSPQTGGNGANDFRTTAVLGSTTKAPSTATRDSASTNTAAKAHASYSIPLMGVGMAGIILLAGERDRLRGLFVRGRK